MNQSTRTPFPKELQHLADTAINKFHLGEKNPEELMEIYRWLESEGLDELALGTAFELTVNLEYLSSLLFHDDAVAYSMDIPNNTPVTNEDRIKWGRYQIKHAIEEGGGYTPSLHTYRLSATNGRVAVIGCSIEVEGQLGPAYSWQGLFKSEEEFFQELGVGNSLWIPSEHVEIPDEIILGHWRGYQHSKPRSM